MLAIDTTMAFFVFIAQKRASVVRMYAIFAFRSFVLGLLDVEVVVVVG